MKEFHKKKKEGYYSLEAKEKRKAQQEADQIRKALSKITEEYNKKVSKAERERNIKMELLSIGHMIDPRTGNINGAIYYEHANELNFNWSSEKFSEQYITELVDKINPKEFKGLKISIDKKHLKTI